jgi:DNA-directed RNA polymerase specialized sigma24 family protein
MVHEQHNHTELLVIRCQQGETDVFELIVNQWQKPLQAFAQRYFGHESDALDVVQ